MNSDLLASAATWIGVAIVAVATIYNLRRGGRKTDAETGLTEAQTTEVEHKVAQLDEEYWRSREQTREDVWQKKLDSAEEKFDRELDEVRDEVQMLRRFIERHVPWDWKAVRELRLLGSDIEDPPTLTYLRDGNGTAP